MAIEITIKNKSGKDIVPDIEYITNGTFMYGSFDGVRLNHNQTGPDGSISMFHPEHIGRSISVDFGKDTIGLYMPLPTSAEDIDDLYETARRVADFWGGEVEAQQDDAPFDPYNSKENAEAAKQFSLDVLKQITDGEMENLILYCALWAIYLDENDVKLLGDGSSLDPFRDFMHRMQNVDAYYACPRLLTIKYSTNIFGMYVFTEGVVSIVPVSPRMPLGVKDPRTGKPPVVEDWYICLYSNSEERILGHIMYDDLMKALKPEDYFRYDAQNIMLKGLTRERIDAMLKKFGTQPPR